MKQNKWLRWLLANHRAVRRYRRLLSRDQGKNKENTNLRGKEATLALRKNQENQPSRRSSALAEGKDVSKSPVVGWIVEEGDEIGVQVAPLVINKEKETPFL